jgi:acyl-coenzyme A thioesterase PaaI-like protein
MIHERDKLNTMTEGNTGQIYPREEYQKRLEQLKKTRHGHCVFTHHPPVRDLLFQFQDNGSLMATFVCEDGQQGYDGVAHGGLMAAVIDASMVQCCMGNGLVAVTTDLNIRYRKPVLINIPTELETHIISKRLGRLVSLQCEIRQEGEVRVAATGRFCKVV